MLLDSLNFGLQRLQVRLQPIEALRPSLEVPGEARVTPGSFTATLTAAIMTSVVLVASVPPMTAVAPVMIAGPATAAGPLPCRSVLTHDSSSDG